MVHLRLRERKLRVDDVEHDALARAVLLACDEVVLLRLVYGVLRRVQTVFRLLHREVRRADVVVHIVPVLFQLQPRGIERRFRRLDARFLSAAVKDVPIHIDACRHAATAVRRRLEVLVRRRAQREVDLRRIARFDHLDVKLLAHDIVIVDPKLLAVLDAEGEAVGKRGGERAVYGIVGEAKRLVPVHIHKIPKLRQADLILVLRLDERLTRIGKLHGSTQYIHARLAARREKLLDVRQMRLVVVDGRLVHTDGLLRLQRVVIRLDDGKTQLLLGACRLEARRQDGDLGAVDTAARLAAVPDIDTALDRRLKPRRCRVTAIIPISAYGIAARSADGEAFFALRLAE